MGNARQGCMLGSLYNSQFNLGGPMSMMHCTESCLVCCQKNLQCRKSSVIPSYPWRRLLISLSSLLHPLVGSLHSPLTNRRHNSTADRATATEATRARAACPRSTATTFQAQQRRATHAPIRDPRPSASQAGEKKSSFSSRVSSTSSS